MYYKDKSNGLYYVESKDDKRYKLKKKYRINHLYDFLLSGKAQWMSATSYVDSVDVALGIIQYRGLIPITKEEFDLLLTFK